MRSRPSRTDLASNEPTSSSARGTPLPRIDKDTLGIFAALADAIADRVVDRLRSGDFADYVDQASSPLGRRRHIVAIRTGALRGKQLGRRYLASRADVDAFMATDRAKAPATHDLIAQVENDLGLRRTRVR